MRLPTPAWVARAVLPTVLLSTSPALAEPSDQERSVRVLDQTGLPLPGVTIECVQGNTSRPLAVSGSDGTFLLSGDAESCELAVHLDGFEPAHTPARDAREIVLAIARTEHVTTVTAPAAVDASPTALTTTVLTQTTVARLPSSHMHAKESLPLLPSVVRGADGLLQLGGARAYQTPLVLDGFNVTDPATGLSSLNLPLEAVLSVDALRDPMAVTYGGLLGGLVRMESRAGGAMPAFGVQGFIPRPRFATPGFGRLEGIFPRAHLAGKTADERLQYAFSAEYDYERIPVPGVTEHTGRDLVDESGIGFARIDAKTTALGSVTVEAFVLPTRNDRAGLSPRRAADASVTARGTDAFTGVTLRHVFQRAGLLTLRAAGYRRNASATPSAPVGSGPALLDAGGWRNNWFSRWSRRASRVMAAVTWDRPVRHASGIHDFSVTGDVAHADLDGGINQQEVRVFSPAGALVRQVGFAAPTVIRASNVSGGFAARDTWTLSPRLQFDAGVRYDASQLAASAPSARLGVRYTLDESGRTSLKGGVGTFVGVVPLLAAASAGYPARVDSSFDEVSGTLLRQQELRPAAADLRLPRARAAVVSLEREIQPGLDAQIAVTSRASSRLPVLVLPDGSGDLRIRSQGTASYRELQLSVRRVLAHDQMVFLSYIRSSARNDLNEVTAQTFDAPLLERGGLARNANDAPNRVLAWGTLNLPWRMAVSPALEWHTGFPYSDRHMRYTYAGTPNGRRYPAFTSLDLVAYKTVTVRDYTADVGVQLFNATGHWNPRDVYPVLGAPAYGQFANSVGRILRGYMLLKW